MKQRRSQIVWRNSSRHASLLWNFWSMDTVLSQITYLNPLLHSLFFYPTHIHLFFKLLQQHLLMILKFKRMNQQIYKSNKNKSLESSHGYVKRGIIPLC